jgi:HAD superfamily hydrolase (TIGR01509 family)
MTQTRAVIFDMDGVLVDSEPRHERAFLEVARETGHGDNHGIRFADYIGRTDRDLWTEFAARNRPAQTVEELLTMKSRHMVEIIRREKPLFRGVSELVRKLAADFRLGIASGSDRALVEAVLALDGLAQFFYATVTGSEVARGKPAPDIFLRAAELLGVSPGDCWVIEDSKPGVAAGLAAGMKVIAITNTYPASELQNATRVVGSYGEIGQLLAA